MIKKKILQIVFHDGSADGIRVCMSPLSPIKAFVIPRSDLIEAECLVDAGNPGVYFLVNQVGGALTNVSIGQIDSGISGLCEFNTQKDFWNFAILFSANRSYFSPGMLNNLVEYVKHVMRINAGNARNSETENRVAQRSSAKEYGGQPVEEAFLEIEFIMSALGFRLRGTGSDALQIADCGNLSGQRQVPFLSPGLLIARRKNVVAFGLIHESSFELQSESEIDFANPAHVESYNIKRRELLRSGVILPRQDGRYFLARPVTFDKPSGASNFALGGSTNGWVEWKDQQGRTLDELVRKRTWGKFRQATVVCPDAD